MKPTYQEQPRRICRVCQRPARLSEFEAAITNMEKLRGPDYGLLEPHEKEALLCHADQIAKQLAEHLVHQPQDQQIQRLSARANSRVAVFHVW